MKRDIMVYVDDILESIDLINTYTQGISQDAFIENIQLQDSVIRRLEVIGEAVKHIPIGIRRRYPTVPWKAVAGLRDVLIHEYFGVDVVRTWMVVQDDLPDLRCHLEMVRAYLESSNSSSK
jgi:uncharacterized protein with HEPN domain